MNWLLELVLACPACLRALGRGLYSLGGFLLLTGWQGHRLLRILDRRLARVPNVDAPQTLAEMYPTLPTWWIPESPEGFAGAAFLLVLGFTTARLGKKLEVFSR